MSNYHVFANSGHEPRVFIIEAESELEARGKKEKATSSGVGDLVEYKGTVNDIADPMWANGITVNDDIE